MLRNTSVRKIISKDYSQSLKSRSQVLISMLGLLLFSSLFVCTFWITTLLWMLLVHKTWKIVVSSLSIWSSFYSSKLLLWSLKDILTELISDLRSKKLMKVERKLMLMLYQKKQWGIVVLQGHYPSMLSKFILQILSWIRGPVFKLLIKFKVNTLM